MTLKVCVAGATGWVGRELVWAVAAAEDMALVGAVAREAIGQDVGEALGGETLDVIVHATVEEALANARADVVIDFTKDDAAKANAAAAIKAGAHVIIGTTGLSDDDFKEIDEKARRMSRGVVASPNFSITAALLERFAVMAAQYIGDVEVIDTAHADEREAPTYVARELAERIGEAREKGVTAIPRNRMHGERATRGATIAGVPVHSVRLPSYWQSVEALFALTGERLRIRIDANDTPEPFIQGAMLAARHVSSFIGVRRGLDAVLARL